MSWNGKDSDQDGYRERGFEVSASNGKIPGVYWAPEKADRLVLLGHGGSTHKKVEYIQAVAGQLAARGIASMAIDGPGHGERAPAENATTDVAAFASIWEAGGGTSGVIEDWGCALDFIEAECGNRPTGWWGLSMGTMMGLPVTASDSRISIALLGLMGDWGPNGDDLKRLAPDIRIPVRFLMQWDDEIVPRDSCLALFGAIGSTHKTLHANPGAHAAVPQFEVDASVQYLDDHLK